MIPVWFLSKRQIYASLNKGGEDFSITAANIHTPLVHIIIHMEQDDKIPIMNSRKVHSRSCHFLSHGGPFQDADNCNLGLYNHIQICKVYSDE